MGGAGMVDPNVLRPWATTPKKSPASPSAWASNASACAGTRSTTSGCCIRTTSGSCGSFEQAEAHGTIASERDCRASQCHILVRRGQQERALAGRQDHGLVTVAAAETHQPLQGTARRAVIRGRGVASQVVRWSESAVAVRKPATARKTTARTAIQTYFRMVYELLKEDRSGLDDQTGSSSSVCCHTLPPNTRVMSPDHPGRAAKASPCAAKDRATVTVGPCDRRRGSIADPRHGACIVSQFVVESGCGACGGLPMISWIAQRLTHPDSATLESIA